MLRENCSAIRAELERLTGKVELGLKLRWNVENIFAYLVLCDNQLREARDRVFRKSQASFDEKIAVGSLFEARLSSERNRLSDILWSGLDQAIYDKRVNPPRDEKTVCNAALLIERRRSIEFAQALEETAGFFDSSFALEYNGPWPPYSFVNLRLHHAAHDVVGHVALVNVGALHGLAHDYGPQLHRGEGHEGATEFAERCSGRAENYRVVI